MLRNYFKIAWRHIAHHKTTSAINILGLSLGICACLIIYLITAHEMSFDKFHPDSDRIYRVTGTLEHLNGDKFRCGCMPNPTAPALRKLVPGVEAVANFFIYDAHVTVPDGSKTPKQFEAPKSEMDNNIIIAEPQYFSIFQYQWLAGNAATALNDPFKVVLSEKEARRYFDDVPLESIVGRQVVYNDSLTLTVSGIVKDWTANSDLDFKDFISFSTVTSSFIKNGIHANWANWDINNQVFIKLAKNVRPDQLNATLSAFSKELLKPSDAKPAAGLQPLSDIHFNHTIVDEYSRKASLPALYGLMAIAAFILIIAAINFINLSTAQSIRRAKETGIRKVLGSTKKRLVLQFLSETFLLTLFSIGVAVLATGPLLKLFHSFMPVNMHFAVTDPKVLLFLGGIALVTTLLSGFYPAKVLASYLPAVSLKGQGGMPSQRSFLRRSLVVFQFTISIVFIVGTLIIGKQIHYMLNKDMGFRKDAIVNIQTDWHEPASKKNVLAQRIKELPGVSMVSISGNAPAAKMQNGTILRYQKNDVESQLITADEQFLPMYAIKLVAGNNYRHSDTINQLLINETAARSLGFKTPEEAVGKSVFMGMSDRPNSHQVFPITGVVADFHTQSLHDAIGPLFLVPSDDWSKMINIRMDFGKDPHGFRTTMASIEKIWKQIYPGKSFEYSFFDETIAQFYEKDQKAEQIVNAAMAIAIFISCMGLFGLIAFSTEQRTKEIGIRKVLGATVSGIMVLLCKDLVLLVFIADVIATPVAWFFMHRWLQDYPYRIAISWWIFLLAGLGATVIALVTISFKAIRAAVANPVKSLRTE
ncbi:MAG TPA: ABC transporter permease [Puia sp.]|nr:ABC transporter permease [Puia sp.]